MKLLVFTFPDHFYVSQIAAIAALKNLNNITDLVFVWDDLAYKQTKEETEKFLRTIKDRFNCETVTFSQFPEVSDEPNGWLRQQYVKLQLHKIFNDSQWCLLDGDVVINSPIEINSDIVFTTDEYDPGYFDFIKYSLNLQKQSAYSFICPLIVFERSVLAELENHCLQSKGKDLIQLFKQDYPNKQREIPPFSEFEIYGTFATQIYGKKYSVKQSPFVEIHDPMEFRKALDTRSKDIILKGSDHDLSKIGINFDDYLPKIN